MAAVETVEWGGRVWRRYPESRSRTHRVYYQCHTKWKEPPLFLHREIWRAAHGDIPRGHHIHHRDGNPSNNALDNLECLPVADHRRRHGGVCSDAQRAHLARIRGQASEWHRSDAGREWHRQHAASSIGKREYKPHRCVVCGVEYMATRGRYCSGRCTEAARRQRGSRTRHRLRCELCGGEFEAQQRTQRFCGYTCSNRARHLPTERGAGVQPAC